MRFCLSTEEGKNADRNIYSSTQTYPTGAELAISKTYDLHFLNAPHADSAILPASNKVSIAEPNFLDDGRTTLTCVLITIFTRRSAIPVPRLCLVVHLDHGLAGSRDNALGIKRHARNRVVVGVCVKDATGAKVPYLYSTLALRDTRSS